MDILIALILCWVIAFGIGYIVSKPRKKEPIGTLRIDRSEPNEAPLLFLELSTDPRNIMNEKQIVLNVNTESYISQK